MVELLRFGYCMVWSISGYISIELLVRDVLKALIDADGAVLLRQAAVSCNFQTATQSKPRTA